MSRRTLGRRRFVGTSIAASVLGGCGSWREPVHREPRPPAQRLSFPVLVGTWEWGELACRSALARIRAGGSLLDGIEAGVVAVERDPNVVTVGVGGIPNAAGVVQLDAMIMRGSDLSAGAVGSLEDIATPIAVARRVMERTPHIFLVGAGARQFAMNQGFATSNLLTDASRVRWERWRAIPDPGSQRSPDAHDTVGLIGTDGREVVCGMSTSGLAFKMPGRVGDSPLVGAGGYADAEVGAAAATGIGEEVIRVVGSHSVVQAMAAGAPPDEACRRVLEKLRRRRGDRLGEGQVAFIAVRRDGELGAAALRPGFEFYAHRYAETRRYTVDPIAA